MNKNDIVTVKITDMGTEGEGIGKIDGFTLFINGAVVGDTVSALVLKVKKTYAYAKIVEVLEASPCRVEPKCGAAVRCGGCQIQQIDYKEQLRLKEKKVFDCLNRIGGFETEYLDERFESIIGMEQPWFYRNKAQYPIGMAKDGSPKIGFYAYHSHNIIEEDNCAIQHPVCADIIKVLRGFIKTNNLSVYDEETGRGELRHCLIRYGRKTGETMVCLVVNAKGKALVKWTSANPNMKNLWEMLTEAVARHVADPYAEGLHEETENSQMTTMKLTSLCVNVNNENTNVILGNELINVFGEDYITDYIGNVKFQINPMAFYQVNPEQTEKLYNKALEYANLNGNETVWDLYCGIGTISLFLAQKAKKVYGVEIVLEAIENAKNNARLNNMENTEFYCGAAETVAPKLVSLMQERNETLDILCVDPPRKGCDATLLDTILTMEPKRIVYVSCDPATLARDLKILRAEKYTLEKVCPVDQFAHSGHVETVVLLGRKNVETVSFDIDVPSLGIRTSKRATYKEIEEYVYNKYGLKVSNLYIAQIKKKYGIELGENHNLPKSEDARQPICPKEKEDAIIEALKHFGLI